MHAQFLQVRTTLTRLFHEREALVDGLLVALLSRQHVFLLGTPGTAKSAIARALAACCSIRFFFRLMTKTSLPEDLFGPIDLAAYEKGEYRRVTTNRLPEADLVVLDEVGKTSSAALNQLLLAMNEREYEDGHTVRRIPLMSLIGTSNELLTGEETGAINDRFLLRFFVKPIQSDAAFLAFLQQGAVTMPSALLSQADLEAAQTAVAQIPVPDDVCQMIARLRTDLAAQGIIGSDRRWGQGVRVCQAAAWLAGRSAVSLKDLMWYVHILWHTPDQIRTLTMAIQQLVNPLAAKALELLDEGADVAAEAEKTNTTQASLEAVNKLKALLKQLDDLVASIPPADHPDEVADARTKLRAFQQTHVSKALGYIPTV